MTSRSVRGPKIFSCRICVSLSMTKISRTLENDSSIPSNRWRAYDNSALVDQILKEMFDNKKD